MSLQTKAAAAKELVTSYGRWSPIKKVYASLRDSRIEYYSQDQLSKLPATPTLHIRNTAVNQLYSDVNFKKFPVSKELTHPDGNPGYYATIMGEAMRENKKSSVFTAIKETTFGWFK